MLENQTIIVSVFSSTSNQKKIKIYSHLVKKKKKFFLICIDISISYFIMISHTYTHKVRNEKLMLFVLLLEKVLFFSVISLRSL